jgi:hypothetical protein
LPPGLLELEAEVLNAYWSLLRSGLPPEWLQDERREFVQKLKTLRDAEGAAMVAAEEAGDAAEFTERRQKYEALASVVPEAKS